ncbi:DUF397 domain-containing protein [Actinomadura sp.]|uniref:DUF397 domain-containing protein n=1 Tax=Actinomadura sp. TaxID=1989 RepID=UPI00335A9D40
MPQPFGQARCRFDDSNLDWLHQFGWEIGLAPVVAVRDSKDPDGPQLVFGAAEWRAFAQRAKARESDLDY